MLQATKETAMAYKSITVKRLAGALGAEIQGVDLSADLDNETINAVLEEAGKFVASEIANHSKNRACVCVMLLVSEITTNARFQKSLLWLC